MVLGAGTPRESSAGQDVAPCPDGEGEQHPHAATSCELPHAQSKSFEYPTCFIDYLEKVSQDDCGATEYYGSCPSTPRSTARSMSVGSITQANPLIDSEGFPVIHQDCSAPSESAVALPRVPPLQLAALTAPPSSAVQLGDLEDAPLQLVAVEAPTLQLPALADDPKKLPPIIDMKRRKKSVNEQRAQGSAAIRTPNIKRKRLKVAAGSANKKSPPPKNASGSTKPRTADVVTGSDVLLVRGRLSGPTKEAVPRCEVTAVTNANKKTHVCTLTKVTGGKNCVKICQEVKSAIDSSAETGKFLTKAAALKIRDALLES